MAIPIIDPSTCNGCAQCVDVCPPRGISMKDDVAIINRQVCEECGECAEVCPVGAIEIPSTKA